MSIDHLINEKYEYKRTKAYHHIVRNEMAFVHNNKFLKEEFKKEIHNVFKNSLELFDSIPLGMEESIQNTLTNKKISLINNDKNDFISNVGKKISSIGDNISSSLSNSKLIGGAINLTKDLASKTVEFAKSSVAAANDIPDNLKQDEIIKLKEELVQNPKGISGLVERILPKLGKGVAVAGLATVSIPFAIAAAIGLKAWDSDTKEQTMKSIKADLIRVDAEIKKAESEGNHDRVADLLILQDSLIDASKKLKYGINASNYILPQFQKN